MPFTTLNNVEYWEWAEGFSESFNPEGGVASRMCLVAHDNARLFCQDMLGTVSYAGDTIFRALPERHPWHSDLICTSVEAVQGVGPYDNTGSGAALKFTAASGDGGILYRVNYTVAPFSVREDGDWPDPLIPNINRFVERLVEFDVTNMILPGGRMVWLTAPSTPIEEGVPKALASSVVRFVLHRWPRIPDTAIMNCLGHINNAAFDTGPEGENYPEGTLLLLGAAAERFRNPFNNTFEYKIIYTMGRRDFGVDPNFPAVQAGWNHIFRATAGEFQRVYNPDTTLYTYETANFRTLFGTT